MTFRTITVHLDHSKHCATRLELSCALAQRYDAHLVGVYAVEARSPADFLPESDATMLARMGLVVPAPDTAAAAFEAIARRTGVDKREFRAAQGDAVRNFTTHARHADLIVVGQGDPDEAASGAPTAFAELVTLAAGTPALVVPYFTDRYPHVGQRVLIAWDGSREATRAVKDALPVLRQAREVVALAIHAGRTSSDPASISIDLATYLSHHGVRTEAAQTFAGDIDIGTALLARAADYSADLIVMGAYGHSRLRELVLGGVTQTVLKHMTAPVLMSH